MTNTWLDVSRPARLVNSGLGVEKVYLAWSINPDQLNDRLRSRSKVALCASATLPAVLESIVEPATAQCDDWHRGQSRTCGSLKAGSDDSLAASLDDAGANEQVLTAEFWVIHPLGVVFKVNGAHGSDQLFDLAFIEQALLMDGHSGLLVRGIVGVLTSRQGKWAARHRH